MMHIVFARCLAFVAVTGLTACANESAPPPAAATSTAQPGMVASSTQATPVGSSGMGGMGGTGGMGTNGMGAGNGMGGMGGAGMMQPTDCPMTLAGTNVQTTAASKGMDMMFTTSGDVTELRRRVREMAEHMSAHASTGDVGLGGGMMSMMMGMPAVHVQVEDTKGGARINMMPVDPSRLDEMRQHMQQGTQTMMQNRDCPMAPGGTSSARGKTP